MNNLVLQSTTRLKWNTINLFLEKVLTFMSFYVIGVKLNAEIYGIKTIAFIILGLGDKCTQFRFSKALGSQDLTNEQSNSLFWFNLMLSMLVGITLSLIILPISLYFQFPILFYLIALSSISYLFKSPNLIFNTLLSKFKLYEQIESGKVIRSICKRLSLILFINLNCHIYSFAFSHLFEVLALTLYYLFIFRKNKLWLPSLNFQFKSIQQFFHFDKSAYCKNILNYFLENIHDIIIGLVFGYKSLGLYNFAKKILKKIGSLFSQTLRDISRHLFKQIQKNKLPNFKQYYLSLIKTFALLIIPGVIFLLLFADNLLHFLFKHKWNDGAIMFKIFAVIMFFNIFYRGFVIPGLSAFKQLRKTIIQEIYIIPFNLILLIIAAFISVEAIILTYLIVTILRTYTAQNLLNKTCGITTLTFYKQLFSVIIISTVAVIVVLIVQTFLINLNNIYLGMIFSLVYLILIIFWEKQNFLLIKQLITSKG